MHIHIYICLCVCVCVCLCARQSAGFVLCLRVAREEYYFSVFGSVNQSAEIVPFLGAAGTTEKAPQGVLFECFGLSKEYYFSVLGSAGLVNPLDLSCVQEQLLRSIISMSLVQ